MLMNSVAAPESCTRATTRMTRYTAPKSHEHPNLQPAKGDLSFDFRSTTIKTQLLAKDSESAEPAADRLQKQRRPTTANL